MNPDDRFLDLLFPEQRGGRRERLYARWARRLTNLADRACRIPLDSDAMPTGVWALVSRVGGWLLDRQMRLTGERWKEARQ